MALGTSVVQVAIFFVSISMSGLRNIIHKLLRFVLQIFQVSGSKTDEPKSE